LRRDPQHTYKQERAVVGVNRFGSTSSLDINRSREKEVKLVNL
jgi:hypothetical protein